MDWKMGRGGGLSANSAEILARSAHRRWMARWGGGGVGSRWKEEVIIKI